MKNKRRYRAAYQDRFHNSVLSLGSILLANSSGASKQQRERMCLLEGVPVCSMTLRQLRDSVQNMQFHWVKCHAAETMQPNIREAVDALFHR